MRQAPAPGVDFEYIIHNADGGEVEQCGNGARCFARFVFDKGLTDKKAIRVQTQKGVIAPELMPDGRVTVNMGQPRLNPAEVPFDTSGLTPTQQHQAQQWPVQLGQQAHSASAAPGSSRVTRRLSWVARATSGAGMPASRSSA